MIEMILKMTALTSLCVALTALLWKRFGGRQLAWPERLLLGFVFGLLAVGCTHLGVNYGHMMLNVRDIAPLAAGLLFHPVCGIIAGVIGGVERYIAGTIWNIGAYTRLACSVSTVLAGLLPVVFSHKAFGHRRVAPITALFIGQVTEVFHMYVVLITHREDPVMAYYVVRTCALPMIAFTSLGLMACVYVARNMEEGWTNPFRGKKPQEVTLSQRFQMVLLMVTILVFALNFTLSFMIHTQEAAYEARQTLADVSEDIADTYERVLRIQKGVTGYIGRNALEDARAIAAAAARLGTADEAFLNTMKDAFQLEDVRYIPGDAGDERQTTENGRVTAWAGYGEGAICVTLNLVEVGRSLDMGALNDALSLFHVGRSGAFEIVDASGKVIAGNHLGETLGGELLKTLSGVLTKYSRIRVFYQDALCLAQPLSAGAMLACYLPLDEVYADRNARCYEEALGDFLLVAVIYLVIAVVVRTIVENNLEKVNGTLGRITHGDLEQVVDVRASSEFSQLSDDINQTVEVLKSYISAARKRIEQELELARTIQDAALPKNFNLSRDDIELYATMDPAREVGGDFYDFFFIDGNRLAMVIADVSGKGIPAALFMMRGKTAMRGLAQEGGTPAEILSRTNDALCEGNDAEMFITAWIGIIDLETGRMQCASAGHEYPVLMRAGEDYAVLKDRHGLALAVMEGMHYKDYEIEFRPGDRLFVYTDGVPEAINEAEEQYGTQRLVDVLNATKARRLDEVLPEIRKSISDFEGGAKQFDDITMLGFAYYGSPDGRNQL